MRVVTPEDGEELSQMILARKSYDPDVALEVEGGEALFNIKGPSVHENLWLFAIASGNRNAVDRTARRNTHIRFPRPADMR